MMMIDDDTMMTMTMLMMIIDDDGGGGVGVGDNNREPKYETILSHGWIPEWRFRMPGQYPHPDFKLIVSNSKKIHSNSSVATVHGSKSRLVL